MMVIQKEKSFAVRLRSVSVTLLLDQTLHTLWLAHLAREKLGPGVHLRMLLENYVRRAVRETVFMHDRARSCYQPKGPDYVRHAVKLNWDTWAGLQALARGLGLSTCHLVSILIELDVMHKRVGVPTDRVFPQFNTVHRLTVVFDLELTRPYLRRWTAYEKHHRNPGLAEAQKQVRTLYQRT